MGKRNKTGPIILRKGKQELSLDYQELRSAVLILRSLNHKLRRQMLALFTGSDKLSVTDVYVRMRLEQSVASQHLASLRRTHIVATSRSGKFIFYALNAPELVRVNILINELSGKSTQNVGVQTDEAALKTATNLLRAIAHDLRLKLIEFIDKNKAVNVNKIYNTLKLEQSITSQHLRVLRSAGLVETKREGKYILYTVNYDRIQAILVAISQFTARQG